MQGKSARYLDSDLIRGIHTVTISPLKDQRAMLHQYAPIIQQTYRLRDRTQPLDMSYPNLTPTVLSDPLAGDLGHSDCPNSTRR